MTIFLFGILLPCLVDATSFKMDFLSSGTVRTDPLMFSQIGNCLSDHVHRFYGATSPRTMRPDVTYEDLRRAPGNTGNVEENKSLYWNPAIYQVKNPNGDQTFELVDIWFASAYYIFQTNQAKAFPNGLKMKAFGDNKLSRATVVCDGPYACERDDAGGCNKPGTQITTLITIPAVTYHKIGTNMYFSIISFFGTSACVVVGGCKDIN